MDMDFEDLKNKQVVDQDAQLVGVLRSVRLDSVGWHWPGLVVKIEKTLRKNLPVSRGVFSGGTLVIPTRYVKAISDQVLLNVSAVELIAALNPKAKAKVDKDRA